MPNKSLLPKESRVVNRLRLFTLTGAGRFEVTVLQVTEHELLNALPFQSLFKGMLENKTKRNHSKP